MQLCWKEHYCGFNNSPPSPQLRTSPRFGWVGPGRLNTKTAHICIYVLLFGFVASWLDGNKRDEPMFVSMLALVHSSLQPLHKKFPRPPTPWPRHPEIPPKKFQCSVRSDRIVCPEALARPYRGRVRDINVTGAQKTDASTICYALYRSSLRILRLRLKYKSNLPITKTKEYKHACFIRFRHIIWS